MDLISIGATVITAFFPALLDGAKMGLARLFGVATTDPKTFDDYVRLRDLDIRQLDVMAKLDQPYGEISKWVANLRSSSRYFAVLGIIGAFIAYSFVYPQVKNDLNAQALAQLAGSALFFLIGDRVYLGLKKSK